MIGHIITDNTAIRLDVQEYGIGPWFGYESRRSGFSIRGGGDLFYSDPKTSRVIIAIGIDLREYENLYTLFYQPAWDWHRDPDTGLRIPYRYLEPVEWLFG